MAGNVSGPEGSGAEPMNDFKIESIPHAAGIPNHYDEVIKRRAALNRGFPLDKLDFYDPKDGPFFREPDFPRDRPTGLEIAHDKWLAATNCGPIALTELSKGQTFPRHSAEQILGASLLEAGYELLAKSDLAEQRTAEINGADGSAPIRDIPFESSSFEITFHHDA